MGWDPDTKQCIKSEVTPNSNLKPGGVQKTGGDLAKSAFGAAEAIVVNQPVFTVDEAKAIATSISDEMTRDFIEAEGLSYGAPELKAGKKVEITGVGERFGGEYFITSATHIYSKGLYHTKFSASGRLPNTVDHILGYTNGNGHEWSKVNGLVTGLVTNNKDEKGLGRVKVKFPWLPKYKDQEIDSHWARIAAPMAGQSNKGVYYIPEVDDEVLVGFEHGDMRYPYIVGALWNNKDKPPENSDQVVQDGKTNQWIIRSRSGHTIILDDSDGEEKIIIRDKTEKNEMIIDSKENTLTMNMEKDININANGNIAIKAKGDMSIECKNWSVKAQQNGAIEATQNVNIKATQSGTMEANQKLTLKGSMQAEMEGGTQAIVKSGAKVGIQGGAMVEVQGGLIKLN
jgi:uncharacterized protein involved in type VI secretion and phage assembly